MRHLISSEAFLKNNMMHEHQKPIRALWNTNYIWIILLVGIGLSFYTVNHLWFQELLGWDEVDHFSIAQGISRDFDFSTRQYMVLDIIKYGYPLHHSNYYPLFHTYLALFFKLFGESPSVAYFANWVAAIGASIFIYYIALRLYPRSRRFAFFTALAYFLIPGIWRNIHTSSLMEPLGACLLAIATLVVLAEYQKKKFTALTILKFSLLLLLIFLYKMTLFGFLFGIAAFIIVAYHKKWSGDARISSIPLPLFLLAIYGAFALLFLLASRFLFYPMPSFFPHLPTQESAELYNSFLGGFFQNLWGNLWGNVYHFFRTMTIFHLIYPAQPTPYLTSYMIFARYFFFLFFAAIFICAMAWKKLESSSRLFVILAAVSILAMNTATNIFTRMDQENIHRYNLYYLPLFVPLIALAAKIFFEYLRTFITEHPWGSKILAAWTLAIFFIPLFATMFVHQLALERRYHKVGTLHARIIQHFIRGYTPQFVYFNKGTHTTEISYPVRVVSQNATNEELLKINEILPEPIAFLFLRSNDMLYKNNRADIEAKKSILDGRYRYENRIKIPEKNVDIVVYRLAHADRLQ